MAESTNWFSTKVFIDSEDVLALAGIESESDGVLNCVVRGTQVEINYLSASEPTIVTPGGSTDISAAWPIGSIYMSAVVTNPSSLLGFGTWAAIGAGRMLLGADGTHALGTTGGTTTPTGIVSQPTFTGSALGTHTHTFTGDAVASNSVSAGTPAGTNSAPTFTGSALATHFHELPFSKAAGGTGQLKMLAQTVFGSGTSRAPESISAAPTANTTASTVALSEAKTAGTPSGTVSAPTFTGSALGTHSHTTTSTGANSSVSGGTPAGTVSQPTFTGNSSFPPYLSVNIWQRTS